MKNQINSSYTCLWQTGCTNIEMVGERTEQNSEQEKKWCETLQEQINGIGIGFEEEVKRKVAEKKKMNKYLVSSLFAKPYD